jgi:hypothetical protein
VADEWYSGGEEGGNILVFIDKNGNCHYAAKAKQSDKARPQNAENSVCRGLAERIKEI